MNSESSSNGILARPATSAGAIHSAAPLDLTRGALAPRPVMAQPALATTVSPLSLLRALRRRSALALGIAIFAAGITGPAAWYLVPLAKFKAQAKVQVVAQPPKILFQTLETQNLGGEEYGRYQRTQQTLVKSKLVLNAALRDPSVANFRMVREPLDPITSLQEQLGVEFVAGSELMEISLSGDNPNEVAGMVNAVKKAYMEEVVNVDIKRRKDRQKMLQKYKERYAEILKARRETLRKLAVTAGSNDRTTLALQHQYAMQYKEAVRKELLDVQMKKRRAEAQLKTMRTEETPQEVPHPVVPEADVNRLIEAHPTIVNLVSKLAEQRDRYELGMSRLKGVARKPVPDSGLLMLRREMAATEKQLAARRKELWPIVVRQFEGQGEVEQVTRGGEIGQELAVLQELEHRLSSELGTLSEGNHTLNVTTLDLESVQDDVAQLEEAANKVGAEVEALNVELEAPSRIRNIEDASIPRVRDDKKRFMMIGLIVVGSFFGGLLGVAFLELQTRKVDSAEQVPLELGLSVVGALPILPARASRDRAIAHRLTAKDRYWQNLLLESIDATRTMLVHAARTGSHRIVMITSAVGGEGKTSLASHLATSLARSGLRTLLIDADLRSPSIHRLFDLPVGPGLGELLRDEIALADGISSTPVECLQILAAGQCDRQALRILAQGSLTPFFDQLKEQFDFVIVDSSPVLPVADASIIAQQVDAVLFSIFRDVSRKTKVFAAMQRLQSLGVRILGAVVTGAEGGLYGNDYASKYTYPALPESAAEPSDLCS